MELKYNFNPKAKLEIQVNKKYYKCSPNVFRSYHGKRRVDGKNFIGERYYFNTNDLYKSTTLPLPQLKPTLKVKLIKRGKKVNAPYMLRTKPNTHRVITV
jgi:hypothetical protein